MRERIIRRYSACFKQQVVSDLEAGRFDTIEAARQHYGIAGKATIRRWLGRYGKHHLQAKVVRVEKPDEVEQMRQLRRRVSQLEQALGQTQAENLLHAEWLKLACQELGTDVEGFKKNVSGRPSTAPARPER